MTIHLVSQLGMIAWCLVFFAITALVITILICGVVALIRVTVAWFKHPYRPFRD